MIEKTKNFWLSKKYSHSITPYKNLKMIPISKNKKSFCKNFNKMLLLNKIILFKENDSVEIFINNMKQKAEMW